MRGRALTSPSINWSAIPESLATRQQWLLWRFEPNPKKPDGKALKVPYWVTGTRRSGTQGTDKDRERLATLANARRVVERDGLCGEKYTSPGMWAGVGLTFLDDDGLLGIDIDGAIDDDGVIRPRDQVIIDSCASYTELSPSGRGIHILCEGTSPINKFDPIGLEIYCGALWFTFTGRQWPGSNAEVVPIEPHVLEGLHKTIDDAKAEAQEQKRIAQQLSDQLAGKRPPAQPPRRAPAAAPGAAVDDFKRINVAAMQSLDAWVPQLFPNAKRRGNGGYRVSSHDLGRDLDEDLSIDPRGIKDFGVHDMGDARDGGRTPIDLVVEWRSMSPKDALSWLAGVLGIELTPYRPPAPAPRSRTREPAPPAGGGAAPPDGPPPGHPAAGDSADDDDSGDGFVQLVRNRRGDPLDCRENVLYALTTDKALKGLVAQNTFTELQERTRAAPWGDRAAGEWDEEDDLMLGEYLLREHGLALRAISTLRAGVQMAARVNRYNPVHNLIRAEPWDGKDRLDTWLAEVFGVVDRPYTRLIGRLFVMGMVKRALLPGCKFDYMLILKGEQGLAKSTAFRRLSEPWFTDNAIRMGDKDSLLTMQLVWLAESAELESLNKADSTAIKQFLSAQEDLFRPPYGARMQKRPRHAVNVGTTNADAFLKDATGDRRFWPLEVKSVNLDRVSELRLQLFAEALHRLEAGERYHPTREEERELVFPEQEQFKMVDPWEDYLSEYVNRRTNPLGASGDVNARRAFFSTRELFDKALAIKADRIDGAKQMETRLGNCMKALGFTRYRVTEGVDRPRGYLRAGAEYGKPVIVPGEPPAPPGTPPQGSPTPPSDRGDRRPSPGAPEPPAGHPAFEVIPYEDGDVPV